MRKRRIRFVCKLHLMAWPIQCAGFFAMPGSRTKAVPGKGQAMPKDQKVKEPDVDVAIIGGGIAGLVAAWNLRPLRCVLFEAAQRPGGRVYSKTVASSVLNLGAHMVPSRHSVVGALVDELGLHTRQVPPSLFGLRDGGRLHLNVAPALLPLVMRLSASERVALVRLGATLRIGAWRSTRAAANADNAQAIMHFEEDRTFADYVGPLPTTIQTIFRAMTERNGADPSEMSAGHGLRSFANVWANTAPSRNIVGGTGALPMALSKALGPSLRLGHRVTGVEAGTSESSSVTVTYRTSGGEGRLTARACIIATPAPIARDLAPALPAATRDALAGIRYGPFLSVAVALKGPLAAPWQGTYAILTPDLGFSVLFDHAGMRPSGARDANSALMLFRGAAGAKEEMTYSDEVLIGRWIADLESAFPAVKGRIADARVGRWERGAPFAFPGRTRLQAVLDRNTPPIALAGDYLDFPNMEAAAASGVAAARRVRGWLEG